jgi:broad specificity phosphatase PhoE
LTAVDEGSDGESLVPVGLDATVVFLRHGESEWVAEGRFQGQGDPALSPDGLRQAALAAERLANPRLVPALPIPAGPPVEIRHSPLRRTASTAAAVAHAMAGTDSFGVRVPVIPDPGFLEIGQGEWEGRHATEIEERWGDVLAGWRRDPLTTWAPGGEPVVEVDRRVRQALHELLTDLRRRTPGTAAPGSQVLGYGAPPTEEPWSIVVGHDGVFKVTLLALLGLPLARFWTFPFALCGISVVDIRAGRARLRAHNLTDHLGVLETERRQELEAQRSRSGAL